ncbi:cytochrome oxidase small assembly protein [Aromatoleum diolicum]|nr:cytochrome oxidase small assembly protein [Aromatoleum diolicum]
MTHGDAPSRRAANRRTGLVLAVVALLFFVAAVVKFKGVAL